MSIPLKRRVAFISKTSKRTITYLNTCLHEYRIIYSLLRKLLFEYKVTASIIVIQNEILDLTTISRINKQHIFFISDDDFLDNYYGPILTTYFNLLGDHNKLKYHIRALNIECQLEQAYCLMRMSSISNINISSNLLFFQVKRIGIQEHFRLVNKALGINKFFIVESDKDIEEAISNIKANNRIVIYYLSNNITPIFMYRIARTKMKTYYMFTKMIMLSNTSNNCCDNNKQLSDLSTKT